MVQHKQITEINVMYFKCFKWRQLCLINAFITSIYLLPIANKWRVYFFTWTQKRSLLHNVLMTRKQILRIQQFQDYRIIVDLSRDGFVSRRRSSSYPGTKAYFPTNQESLLDVYFVYECIWGTIKTFHIQPLTKLGVHIYNMKINVMGYSGARHFNTSNSMFLP